MLMPESGDVPCPAPEGAAGGMEDFSAPICM
jgi:hypothetical protein